MTQPVQLWCGSVADLLRDAADGGVHWLGPAETQRLAGITAPRRRAQFLAGRWQARQALAARHGGTPQDWTLSAPVDAAPQVTAGPVAGPCAIGLSHSGDTVACVLADASVGIDVERHDRRVRDVAALADATLGDAERAHWLRLPAESRRVAFLCWWTLKEAWIKAQGRSLNPASLQAIEALPVSADDANARVWCEADFTLALAGLDADAEVTMMASAPRSVAQWWRVSGG